MSIGKKDLNESARRHWRAAEVLYECDAPGAQPGGKAVAGYLYGLSGEMAIKFMMRESGIKAVEQAREQDPYYAHFPKLKLLLETRVEGRRHSELRKIASNPRLFQDWSIDIRYRGNAHLSTDRIADWRQSAKELIDRMDIT